MFFNFKMFYREYFKLSPFNKIYSSFKGKIFSNSSEKVPSLDKKFCPCKYATVQFAPFSQFFLEVLYFWLKRQIVKFLALFIFIKYLTRLRF